MLKKIIYIAIVFSYVTKLDAQVKDTISNLIILIDDKVPTTISNFRIEFSENNQKTKISMINFEQGRLLLDKFLHSKILSNNISDLKFYFDYSEFRNGNTKNYNYFIEVNKNILNQRIIIVYLYNLDDKEKRKKYRYTQLDKDRKYTFEIDGGSVFIGRPKKR
ncbi:hypothetical protein [Flavobacterium ginsengiterrae]|uniref:Intein n=1 Tax=Flavobacterium ginsengiterrae TaxID=871695 RepID=A0ABP7GU09_9FLAO